MYDNRWVEEKMNDTEFIGDLQALLRPDVGYDAQQAYPLIYQTFIDKMEGKRDWVNLHFSQKLST